MDLGDVVCGLIIIGVFVSVGSLAVDIVFSEGAPGPGPTHVAANNTTNSSTHTDVQQSYDYYNMGYWKTRLNS
jgi:hypothetical protein